MKLSEYLIEAVARKTTGKYSNEKISMESGFLSFLSAVQNMVGAKPMYFSKKPYAYGYAPYDSKDLDLETLGKQISDKGSTPILVDENGALLVTDKKRKSGFYLGFWDNGKLSQVVAFSSQSRNEYYIDYDYPSHPETGAKEFKEWLEENYG